MKALFLAALTVPALVTTAGLHDHVHAHLHDLIVTKLALTPDQQDAAHKVLAAHHPALRAKAQAAFAARADVLQAIANPQSTEGQITALETQASAAHLVLELEVASAVKDLAPILTPDQQAKAQKLLVDARAHVEAFLAGMPHNPPA